MRLHEDQPFNFNFMCACLSRLAHAPSPGLTGLGTDMSNHAAQARVLLFAASDSEESERAFIWCLDNAIEHSDQLHLVHVTMCAQSPRTSDLVPNTDYFGDVHNKSHLECVRAMLARRFLSHIAPGGLDHPIAVHIEQAAEDALTVARVICRVAETIKADQVIVGTHQSNAAGGQPQKHTVAAYCCKQCAAPIKVIAYRPRSAS